RTPAAPTVKAAVMESAVVGPAMESASAPARPSRRGEHEGKHGDDEHETERLPEHVAPPPTNLFFSLALVSRRRGFPVAASPRLAAPSTPGINDRVGAALPGKSFRIEPMQSGGVRVCASIPDESYAGTSIAAADHTSASQREHMQGERNEQTARHREFCRRDVPDLGIGPGPESDRSCAKSRREGEQGARPPQPSHDCADP